MTFQEWVDENGGQIGVARKFGFTSSLIGAWYRFERFPRADNLTLLVAYSEGRINVQQWAADFAERQRQRSDGTSVRQNKIKGNLPVKGFEGQWNENVRLWYNLLIIIQYTKVPFQGPFRML